MKVDCSGALHVVKHHVEAGTALSCSTSLVPSAPYRYAGRSFVLRLCILLLRVHLYNVKMASSGTNSIATVPSLASYLETQGSLASTLHGLFTTYMPLKTGGRFSAKALRASTRSLVGSRVA